MASRLTYRDAVRMAPVAWLDGRMVVIEGRYYQNSMDARIRVRLVATGFYEFCLASDLLRPNAAARRLLEALK